MAGSAAVLAVLDLIGVFANAILGGSVARRHRFDPIGFAALAIVSGLGGGIIRDVLLQQGPPVALTSPGLSDHRPRRRRPGFPCALRAPRLEADVSLC